VSNVIPHPITGVASYFPIKPVRSNVAPHPLLNPYVRLRAEHLKPFSPSAVGDGPKATTVTGSQMTASMYMTHLDTSAHRYNEVEAIRAQGAGGEPKLLRVVHDYITVMPCLSNLQGRDAKKFIDALTGFLMDYNPAAPGAAGAGAGVIGIVLGTFDTVSPTSPAYALAPLPGQARGEVLRDEGEASPCSNGGGNPHLELLISHCVPCRAEGDARATDPWEFGVWTEHPCALRYKAWLLGILRASGAEERCLECVAPRCNKSGIYIQTCVLPENARVDHYAEVVTDRQLAPPVVLNYTDVDELLEKLFYGPLQGLSRGDSGLTLAYIAENADRMRNTPLTPEHAAREPAGRPGTALGGLYGSQEWQEWCDEIGSRPARVVQVTCCHGLPGVPGVIPRTAMGPVAAWYGPGPRPGP